MKTRKGHRAMKVTTVVFEGQGAAEQQKSGTRTEGPVQYTAVVKVYINFFYKVTLIAAYNYVHVMYLVCVVNMYVCAFNIIT